MSRNQRIKEALKGSGVSQGVLATKLGITPAAVNERLNAERDIDSFELILAVSKLTRKSLLWLYTGEGYPVDPTPDDLPVDNTTKETDIKYLAGKSVRPVVVVVDAEQKEMVSYVPVKAQAGYMRGYSQESYVEKLPAFSLPALAKDATYRMFQVDGNSMLQLGNKGMKDGDIVIAQYVDDVISGVRDNRVYVVVTPDGVVIKRCINRLKQKEDAVLICTSDNKSGEYPNIVLRPHQIKEVWEAKRYISSDFSFDTNLYEMLGNLVAEQELLKEKVNRLEGAPVVVKKPK